jgi:hypothetical protein
VGGIFGLVQNLPIVGDHGVGGKDEGRGTVRRHRAGLAARQGLYRLSGGDGRAQRLVRGAHLGLVRYSDTVEEGAPAGRLGGKNKWAGKLQEWRHRTNRNLRRTTAPEKREGGVKVILLP